MKTNKGDLPTSRSKLFVCELETVNQPASAGSDALGYLCSVLWPSISQVNVNDSGSSITLSPFWNKWLADVTERIPVSALYVVPFCTVTALLPTNPWAISVIVKFPVSAS